MNNERRTQLYNKIDASIQKIDDAVQELIRGGERLPTLEAAIRLELGTVFNRAFKTSCEGLKKEKEVQR